MPSALELAHQPHYRALMMGIEADERLVQQQQPRPAEQRLGQQQALALAAGGLHERALGQRWHHRSRAPSIWYRSAALAPGRPPAMTVDGAGDEIPAAEAKAAHAVAMLGHIAHGGIAAARFRLAQHPDAAGGWRDQPGWRASVSSCPIRWDRAPRRTRALDGEADPAEDGPAGERWSSSSSTALVSSPPAFTNQARPGPCWWPRAGLPSRPDSSGPAARSR